MYAIVLSAALCLPAAEIPGVFAAQLPCGKKVCDCGCAEGGGCSCALKKTNYEWRHSGDEGGGWERLYADGELVGVYSLRWGEYYARTGWGPTPTFAEKASPCPTAPPVRKLHMPAEVIYPVGPTYRPAYRPAYYPVQTYVPQPQPVYRPAYQPAYQPAPVRFAGRASSGSC
jgi:hypothetical protein